MKDYLGEVLAEMIPGDVDPTAMLTQAVAEARQQSREAARRPAPRPVTSRSAGHAGAAERALEALMADPGTAAIVGGLLAVSTAIEDAAERLTDDLDTVAAMLDDRITSVEGAMDAVTAALLPAPGPVCRNPVHEIYVRLRYRWRAWRGTAPVPWVALDCAGMCGQPAHDCGGCCCAGGCRCPRRCRCAEA